MMKWLIVRKQMFLGMVMIIAAGLATTFLIIALSSDHLASCFEKQSKSSAQDDGIYISTNFGLWRACSQLTGARGGAV